MRVQVRRDFEDQQSPFAVDIWGDVISVLQFRCGFRTLSCSNQTWLAWATENSDCNDK